MSPVGFTVTERTRGLEPVTRDPFLDGLTANQQTPERAESPRPSKETPVWLRRRGGPSAAPFGDPDGPGSDLIRLFLEARISALDAEFILRPSEKGIARWLGQTEIFDRARAVSEDVEDYLLRAHATHAARRRRLRRRALPARSRGSAPRAATSCPTTCCGTSSGRSRTDSPASRSAYCADRIGATAEALTARLEEIGKDRIDHAAAMALGDPCSTPCGRTGCWVTTRASTSAGELHPPLDKSSYVYIRACRTSCGCGTPARYPFVPTGRTSTWPPRISDAAAAIRHATMANTKAAWSPSRNGADQRREERAARSARRGRAPTAPASACGPSRCSIGL